MEELSQCEKYRLALQAYVDWLEYDGHDHTENILDCRAECLRRAAGVPRNADADEVLVKHQDRVAAYRTVEERGNG